MLTRHHGAGVHVYDAASEELVVTLGGGEAVAQAVSFSPLGRYIQVLHKAQAPNERNLKLYALPSGEVAFAVHEKTYIRDKWPVLQWSEDESVLARAVTNEVQLYSAPRDFSSGSASRRLRVTGVTTATLSPGATLHVAAFVPEGKGQPASIRIYALPERNTAAVAQGGDEDSAGTTTVSEQPPLARRSFFRATFCRFRWNCDGTAVLALATADVDATNQSYYGESSLHFLRADGEAEGSVPLPKEGPVHDVSWSPRGTEFMAVAGFMPAKAVLFSDKLKPLYEVPAGPYNLAKWNPFGRFVALAGFGNLPGDVAFLDRKADAKCKPMAEVRLANSVSLEWSPCGRYVLTATTAPRLQVDNGFRVCKYTGEKLFDWAAAPGQLFQCEWQPAPGGSFPDRPQTPGAAAAAKSAPSVVAATKAAPYRPPGAPRQAAPTAGAPQFSLAREAQPFLKPGAAEKLAASRPQGPPGAEFVDAPQSASAKKRAAAKAREAKAAAEQMGKMNVSK